jgi:hypothetical protein
VQQNTYVRIKIEDDAIKHLISRFFKNSIKLFIISKKIFENLYQIFNDSNRCINALKVYRRLKQIELFKDFNTFWVEFQRLISDFELYNQKTLLKDLKNKMFYELQKALTIKSYKTTDLHKFVKMCHYTNQMLRNVNNKSRREEFFNDAEREEIIIIVNSNQINQNDDNRLLVFDLKSLNSNLNRIFVRSVNHHLKIKWISLIATIVKNLIISHVIVVNSERWIQTVSYAKWTYMKKMIHRVRRIISSSSRKKSNSHQRRDEEQA